jgi:hypothetical protein
MATQKLIQLFEDVLKVNEEGSHTKQQKAKRNANWFYEKCKDKIKLDDIEIDKLAKDLIDRFLYEDPNVINELTKQYNLKKENPEYDKNGKVKPILSLQFQIANELMKKLKWYFKEREKDINTSASVKISKELLRGLVKLNLLPNWDEQNGFQIWTETDIINVVEKYHETYKYLSLEIDDQFAAYKRLLEAYENRISKKKLSDRKPELFNNIVRQFFNWDENPDKNWKAHSSDLRKLLNKWKSHEDEGIERESNNLLNKSKRKTKISNILRISLDDDNALDNFLDKIFYNHSDDSTTEEQLDEINKKCKEIINIYKPPREALLFEILREVTSDPLIRAYKQKEIFNICKERLLKEGINSRYFDKLKSSLLKILTKNRGDGGMLHFTLHNDSVLYFYNLLNSLNIN